MTTSTCIWCGRRPAPGKQPKAFCSDPCRNTFHKACGKLGQELFAAGAVSIECLKSKLDTASKPLTAHRAAEPKPDAPRSTS